MDKQSMLDELRNEIIKGLERKIDKAKPYSSIYTQGIAALYADGKIHALRAAIQLVDLTIHKYKHNIH